MFYAWFIDQMIEGRNLELNTMNSLSCRLYFKIMNSWALLFMVGRHRMND